MSYEVEIQGKDSSGIKRVIKTDSSGNLSAVSSGTGRTTNPTAVADGASVSAIYDKVGRAISWPFQVRDLAATAIASLSNGTSTVLLGAGGTGVFHDMVHVTLSNNSTSAVSVALLDDGTTRKTFQIPASNTLSIDFSYPFIQSTANTIWNVDMEDVTGTTVSVDAVFIKNI